MAGVTGMGNPQGIKSVDDEAAAILAGFSAQAQQAAPPPQQQVQGSVQAPPQSSVDAEAEALLNGFNAQQAPDPMMQKAEDPERSFMDQIQAFPARLEASFANTPERKQFVLERRYGKDNVRKNKDESFDVKKDNKWIKFDSDQTEILSDLADWGRDIVEQGSTEVATAAGMAAAGAESFFTGGAGLPAAAPIVAGARLAGGITGNAIAQSIAHDVYGIPKGTLLDQANELAVAGAANAIFGRVGDAIGNYFTKKGAGKATRIANQTVNESLQTDIKVLDDAAKTLESTGVISPVANQFGGKTTYLPEQAAKEGSEQILLDAKKYAENPEVQNVKGKLMEGLNQVIQKINDKIASVSPIKGSKVLEYANDIEQAEGAIIGKFKKQALEVGGKVKVNADIARQKIKSSMEELGYTFADTLEKTPRSYVLNKPAQFRQVKDIQRPTMESLEARGFTPEAANKLMNRLESNYKEVLGYTYEGKAKINFEKLAALNNNIKELVNDLYKSSDVNTKSRQVLTKVKDAFGDDYQKAIGAILGDTPAGKEFATAMEKFGSIKNAKKDLGRILVDSESGQPTIAAEALAKNLFGSTKQNLKEITAMKKLLKDDPEIWDQIRRVHLDDLMKKNLGKDGTTYNVNGYANDILKLPKEIAIELVGSEGNLNTIKALRVYSDRLQNYTAENFAKSDEARKGLSKLLTFLTNYVQTKGLALYDMSAAIGRGRSVVKYLSDEGRDQMLKLTPVDGRPVLNRVIDNIIEAGAFSENRAIKTSRMLTNGVLVPAAKIETRNAAQDAVSR